MLLEHSKYAGKKIRGGGDGGSGYGAMHHLLVCRVVRRQRQRHAGDRSGHHAVFLHQN